MADIKLTERHKLVLLQRVAEFNLSQIRLSEMLADKESAEKYGYDPVVVTAQRVGQVIRAFPPELVAKERQKFLDDFGSLPLAHKKMRVIELSKLYSKTEITSEKQSILRDIKAEIGEDIEKLANAMRTRNGDNYYNITNIIGEARSAEPDDRATIVRNAIAGLGSLPK